MNVILKIDVKRVSGGFPHEKFLDGIVKQKEYVKNLKRFLDEIPAPICGEIVGTEPSDTIESKSECFVKICKKGP